MADQTPTMPPEVKDFMEKARADGWSDEDIVGYVKEHQAKAPEAPPKPAGWASRYPKTATAIRLGLDTLPGIGAIGGAALAAPETMGLGSVAGAALGAGAGRGLRDLVAEGIGVDEPTGVASKALRIGADTAMTAATPGAIEAVSHPVETAGMALDELGHFIPRGFRNAIKGLKPPSSAEGPVLKVPQWQVNQRIAAAERPHTTVDAVPVDPNAPPPGVQEGEILGESFTHKALPAGASRIIPAAAAPTRPLSDDPSFVRSVPAQPISQPQRLGLPPRREPIITPPPADTSGITVTSAQRGLPVRDPATGRMKRVFTSESAGESPKTPVSTPEKTSIQSKVQSLSQEGHGAEVIADKLKDDPAFQGKTRTERINLVREARGGPSGDMPARAKQAIDASLAKLKTADEKRAYLMRAPNAVAYDYIKGKIGL